MSQRDQIITKAIQNDAVFVGDYLSSVKRSQAEDFVPIVNLCLVNYLSLFVYEGFARLTEMGSSLSTSLSPIAKQVVARSRHSLKFFEDTKRGITGQLNYFETEIIPAHKEEFLGNIWLRFARHWETDLGLYRYSGRIISTTHSATFALGVDPQTMFEEGAGPALRDIWAEFGQYFGALGAVIDSEIESFLDHVDATHFGGIGDDVRSEKFYASGFTGAQQPSVNALLTVFMASLNFVNLILPDSLHYSIFKIRYLTTYQILRSLELLRADSTITLDARSMSFISAILDNQNAQLITRSSAKPFRNTLMHYGPDSRIELDRLDENSLVESMTPLCFNGMKASDLQSILECTLKHTAERINAWSGK